MKRPLTQYFLILGLVLIMTLGLIPVSPALSSNLPSGVILEQANDLSGSSSPNSLIRYSHTLLVSSNGTPIQNGASLRAAMNLISNARPSVSNPYLLKLEPGNYDLGNGSLTLLPFVDLEGSGEDITVISSSAGNTGTVTNATLIAASNSEVRFVKVTNTGPSISQIAVLVPTNVTNARFSHFTSITYGSTAPIDPAAVSFFNNGGISTITDSTLSASGSNSGLWGLFNDHNGTSIVSNSNISVTTTSAFNAIGLDNRRGTAIVTNSTITASGNIQINNEIIGLMDEFADGARVTNSRLHGDSSNSFGLTICPYSVDAISFNILIRCN